jgi:hypothetical protein
MNMMNTKDLLAKLLAQENITVVQQNVETASFNVKDRVLTLPMWDDMENFTYNHLVGHEVGHALYTEQEKWESALTGKNMGYKSFLNVVEDARIEKLIQRRYPGLRRDFVRSYNKMFEDGFFGTNKDEINSLNLIDRINTYFKCGASFGVDFDADEKSIVSEIANVETFEEVIAIVDRLYGKAVEEIEQQKQAMADAEADPEWTDSEEEESEGFDNNFFDPIEDEEGDEEMEGNGGSEETDEEGSESSESSSESADDGQEEGESASTSASTGQEGGKSGEETGPISVTDNALSRNIEEELSGKSDKEIYNIAVTEKLDPRFVVKANEILSWVGEEDLRRGREKFKKFQVNNKKAISYMVKEFEMKKKASEYARTTVSKTGVIDPVLMNNYRYSDDIFKKMSVVPEGKNHGLVMFVDWSGSMHQDMGNTLDQLLNLVCFCKQVQIPFRVYAFTDRRPSATFTQEVVLNETAYDNDFRLLEFFNSKTMKRNEMNQMLWLISWLKSKMYYGYGYIPWQLNLGGTPLNDAIVAAAPIYDAFKKENNLDIVNMVFLTDGDSHPNSAYIEREYGNYTMPLRDMSGRYGKLMLRDQTTKKQYRLTDERSYTAVTNVLLRRLRDRTNANVIGYRILPLNKRSMYSNLSGYVRDYSKIEEMHTALKKERFITIPNSGYSEFFAIAGGRSLATSNGEIQVAEDASKGQIRTAFKKANKGRKESRVMLSKFIEMVA